MAKQLRIVFMGSPEFAIPSLKILLENNYDIAAVITAPDKPSGRGKKLRSTAVKEFSSGYGLKVLQPEKLKEEAFVNELRSLNANLQIVVAFRMLPEIVWRMPELGTFNLHASLLPQYRGAAPINWAIINGEKETGATTFFIRHEIDTGEIIFSEKVQIMPDETFGELHDKLMETGAELVLKTVRAIASGPLQTTTQSLLVKDHDRLHKAPKIFRENCRVDWDKPGKDIYNLIRGLSPWPTAFTELVSPEGERTPIKIYGCGFRPEKHDQKPGTVTTDNISTLNIAVSDGTIMLTELQQAGKKKMNVGNFLRGFALDNCWIVA